MHFYAIAITISRFQDTHYPRMELQLIKTVIRKVKLHKNLSETDPPKTTRELETKEFILLKFPFSFSLQQVLLPFLLLTAKAGETFLLIPTPSKLILLCLPPLPFH